ncbi:pyridoxamine 5'-phosphate oxidase family protein [Roseovarius sp. CAU 1744]|uniref:pyridoxamine 5'-phosphate oxidase family protein n=1 Tax=Roseovarius sp. CAU 1744 TaxID=3140368 RepID=UPI00325A62A6
MPLNQFAKDLIATFPLGFVATVTADGRPALSPKGTFLVLDDETIAFGEIRSPGTLANLDHLPEAEVNFIDQWKRKGVRVRGGARVIGPGAEFDSLIGRWRAVWGDLADRINVLVLIAAQEVRQVTTPPYDDGVTEEEMIALYKTKFAEIYQ